MTTVTIVFPDIRYARMFMTWFCESGEQHYWEETEEYSVDSFNYNFDHLRIITRTRQNPEVYVHDGN